MTRNISEQITVQQKNTVDRNTQHAQMEKISAEQIKHGV